MGAVSVVRALRQAEHQCRLNNRLVAEQQRPLYSQLYMEAYFSMRVEQLGCVLVFLVALFVVLGRGRVISAGNAALALTFSGNCSDSIQFLISKVAEFGIAFNCIERVMEYATTLPQEAPPIRGTRPPEGWPSAGVLEVRNLQLRYRPHLPLVLKGVTFSTRAGERLGVVGRTGAGKSSLLLAIFRLTEPEAGSELWVDGVDLLSLGLRDLRGSLAMIPQEPVLFQASLRYNCDPYVLRSDHEVWCALEEAQLAPWLYDQRMGSSLTTASVDSSPPTPCPSEMAAMLGTEIKEGGQNLSAGQRQMVAIARAVLRRSKFIVLDEATAAVDAATDAAIQLAVRRCFVGATTLTVAHRLQTIMDSDRVMVLSEGEVVELGLPSELLAKETGLFRAMVKEMEKR